MSLFFWTALCLALCWPGLKITPRLIWLAVLLVGLDHLVVMLPVWYHPLSLGLQKNWTGKLFSLLLSLFVIYGQRLVSPREVGFTTALAGAWRSIVPVVLVLAAANFVGGYANRQHQAPPTWEGHLYELTMPGLAEELFSRGVLLGLLTGVFPRTIPFFGTRTSWGGLVGLGLFVLGHGLLFRGPWQLVPQPHFSPDLLVITVYGSLFLWVRERSGSCWAAIATHNLVNTTLYLGLAMP